MLMLFGLLLFRPIRVDGKVALNAEDLKAIPNHRLLRAKSILPEERRIGRTYKRGRISAF